MLKIDYDGFRKYLSNNTNYSKRVITDLISRLHRADSILPYDGTDDYLYHLSQQETFAKLSVSVRSQLRRSISLYHEYYKLS